MNSYIFWILARNRILKELNYIKTINTENVGQHKRLDPSDHVYSRKRLVSGGLETGFEQSRDCFQAVKCI